MTYEEAVQAIPCGLYRHFKGNEYEVIGIARHSETTEPMVVYKALYGDGGIWVRPAQMWNETIERDGKKYKRFEKIEVLFSTTYAPQNGPQNSPATSRASRMET